MPAGRPLQGFSIAGEEKQWQWADAKLDGETVLVGKPELFDAIAHAIGVTDLRVFTTGGDEMEADREQWDDGNNVLAVEPGVVVAYDRNVDTNTKLRRAGIEVVVPVAVTFITLAIVKTPPR